MTTETIKQQQLLVETKVTGEVKFSPTTRMVRNKPAAVRGRKLCAGVVSPVVSPVVERLLVCCLSAALVSS